MNDFLNYLLSSSGLLQDMDQGASNFILRNAGYDPDDNRVLQGLDPEYAQQEINQANRLFGTQVAMSAPQFAAGILERPTTVYHGTGALFDRFDPNVTDWGKFYGPGSYFSSSPNAAAEFAGNSSFRTIGGLPPDKADPAFKSMRYDQSVQHLGYIPEQWKEWMPDVYHFLKAGGVPASYDPPLLYHVEIPQGSSFLDYGKKLSAQPPEAAQYLSDTLSNHGIDPTGLSIKQAHSRLIDHYSGGFGNEEVEDPGLQEANQLLGQTPGVIGNQYRAKDTPGGFGRSRGSGPVTNNYAIWDTGPLRILQRTPLRLQDGFWVP